MTDAVRGRAWLRRLGWLAFFGGIGSVSSARAAESAEPIVVEYDGPPGCPSEEAFFAEVTARTPLARRATEPGPSRTFVVALTKGADASFGRLIIRSADGAESERDVVGDTCAEVVSALSLVAALAVDPNASTKLASSDEPSPPVVPSAGPPASVSTAQTATEAKPTATEAKPTAPSTTALPAPADHGVESSKASEPGPDRRLHLALTVDAAFTTGVVPHTLFGVPVAVELGTRIGPGLRPSLRLGFERASSNTIDVGGATADFTWTVGTLEACPHRWTFGLLDVTPCLRFEGGALEGVGGKITPAHDDTRPWLSVGAVGRAEWALVSGLFLDFEGGFRAPLSRTTYFFEPNTTIYRAPAVGALAAAGLGLRFL